MPGYRIDDFARIMAVTRSRRSVLKGIAATLVIGATGMTGRVRAANGDPSTLVTNYFDAIQRHAWRTAYNMLGAKLHRAQTLQQFTDGFADTAFTMVEITNLTGPLSGNRQGVDVKINAWLRDGTPQAFSGRYFIGNESGKTKIVDANIQVADAAGLASLCFARNLSEDLSGNAGTGHRFGDLVVTNQGATCTLTGLPGVTIKNQSGQKLISGTREADTTLQAVTLDSGQSALLQLDWTNWCGAAITNDVRVTVSLPGSTGNFTINHGFGVPPCLGDPGSASRLSVKPWQPQ